MKKYEEYKQVDLPWISEIPSHWELKRHKVFLNEQKECVEGFANNYKLLSLTKNGVIHRDMENPKGKFPKEFNTYKKVKPNNLILCLFDIDETPRTVGLSKYEGMITGAYNVYEIGNIDAYYLYYYLISLDDTKSFKPLYTGLRKVIKQPTFLTTQMPVPFPDEQAQIVKYLHWKVAKINKYIKAKKRQIELLKELKQAEINRAFDRESLRYTRLKYLAQSQVSSISRIYPENGLDAKICHYPVAYNNKSINGRTTFEEGKCSENDLKKYKLHAEDVVITKDSESSEDIGVPSFITEEIDNCVCGYHLAFLRVFNREIISPKYLYYSLLRSSVAEYYVLKCNGITRFGLNSSIIGNIKVPVIELSLQMKVINYLDDLNKIIDTSLSNINYQIDRISEFKSRLISDVVTGKVDVRDIIVPDNYETESVAEAFMEDNEDLETIN